MRRFLMMTAIAATTLGAAQIASADSRPEGPPPACQRDRKDCQKPPQAQPDHKAPRQGDGQPQRHDEPKRHGDNGHQGKIFHPGKGGKLAEAPRGKEYRVIGDKLVLVNKRTHQIVRVIGPAPR